MSYNKKYKQMESSVTDRNYEPKEKVKDILEYPIMAIPERGITKETCERFGVRTAVDPKDGVSPISYFFPYYDQKGKLCGFKKRDLTLDKNDKGHFTAIGKVGVDCKLFGQQIAEGIPRKRACLIQHEGEFDVMSSFQAMKESVVGTKFSDLEPFVVGLSCGTKNAVDAVMHNIEFVKEFEACCLAFDSDFATEQDKRKGIERGREAMDAVAAALTGTGVALQTVEWHTQFKDPSDYLQNGKSGELAKLLSFGKKVYSAEKIIHAGDISLDELLSPRPEGIYINQFPKLMEKIHGFRTRELVLLTAPVGVGKSTTSAIFASELMEANEKVGMIFLEETNKETLQRMLASKLKVNFNLFRDNPLKCATKEEIEAAYKDIVDNDKMVMLSHFGSMPITELMNKIRYMHLVEKCSYIILDHLSVVISGSHITDERKELDIVMTELAAFCAANDVCVIAISHINRSAANDFKPPKGEEDQPFWVKVTKEQLRGSSALEALSFIIIGIEPQIMPDRSRGFIRLTVLKNRPWGYLGSCDEFKVDDSTWEVILNTESEGF